MGGFGTWETAFEYPDTYAAIAPICGGAGVRWVTASRLKHLPAWIFHGDKDGAVPVSRSRDMVSALKACGGNIQYREYPGAGHDVWTRTYSDSEVLSWFFAQRLAGADR